MADKHWDNAGNCRTCGESGRCTCLHHKIACAYCGRRVHVTNITVCAERNLCAKCAATSRARYPELYSLAMEIARGVGQQINERAPRTQTVEPTPYKAQGTLEILIEILQEAV